MREDLLEKLPSPQTNAKLLMGNTQLMCVIVEVTVDGFRVAVPGVDHYEGEPRITLVTRNAAYPVRLVLQEAHVGGYAYRLQRIENSQADGRSNSKRQWGFVTSQCCAAGLVGVMATSCFCLSSGNDLIPMLSRRGLRNETVGSWSPSIAENDLVPPGISIDSSLVKNDVETRNANERIGDVQTVSVSMISPTSASYSYESVPENGEIDQANVRTATTNDTAGSTTHKSKYDISLKALLDAGQTGRIQPAGRELLGWLYGSAASSEQVSFRMSDAAWLDLQQFEVGLKLLSTESSNLALASLRRTLLSISGDASNAQTVSEKSDVSVANCDDARIFFRKVHGKIELVRVLPIDLTNAERP